MAILAAVLVTLTLSGSAASPDGPRRVLSVENTSGVFALTASEVFTANFGRAPGRQVTIRRHSSGDPAPDWTAELPQTAGRLHVAEPAGVLVVAPNEVLLTTSVDAVQTTFLDSTTGAVLWHTTTERMVRVTGTGVLLSGGSSRSPALRHADPRDGQTLWTYELGAAELVPADPPDAPGPVVVVDGRGRADVLDLDGGAVIGTADLGAPPGPAAGGAAEYTVVGDRGHRADRSSLTAYRLPDLEELWRTTTAPTTRPSGCGADLLCVGTTEGLALLDPATGATLARLGDGVSTGGRLLRADRDERGRTWIQTVGAADEISTQGAIEDVATERCAAAGAYVACPTSAGTLSVWRVPA